MSNSHHDEYDDAFVAGLEWIWGDGFLSPGGPQEVSEILYDVDLTGARVLDIGCGLGGIDILLIREHGAAKVTGIDVEHRLVERAQRNVRKAELADRIDIQLVTPGALPFADCSFDMVFTKDSLIHIPDKEAIYSEMFRVLVPGGRCAFSDWFGCTDPPTPELNAWLELVGLSFELGDINTAAQTMNRCGFVDVVTRDRNAWYRERMIEEVRDVSGDAQTALTSAIGPEAAAQRLASSLAKQRVVEQGQMRPGHIHALRPLTRPTVQT